MLYDAHLHNKNQENGGFLIGLEGNPHFPNTLSNQEALALHSPADSYLSFYYVTQQECSHSLTHKYLKYHARREKYTPAQVQDSISINSPKAVILDTLNEPFWVAYDYWEIARTFPHIPFIFAHSGGYLIYDFIKICHFQPNVWIDFALTHTTLGHLGKKTGLPSINEAIFYALHSPFKNKILLGSDYPFFNQEEVFAYYANHHAMLNDNFLCLFENIK